MVIPQTEAIAQTLSSLVTPDNLRHWETLDPIQQKQLAEALAPGITPSCIVYPNTQEELAQVVECAHRNHWRVLPCGRGSKLSWGGLVQNADLVVSTEHLNRLIEHAVGDLTITVEAGIKFAEIQAILAKAGQFLALDPAYPATATIGGIVATGDAGSLRQRYGGVRDMLLGLSFVRADGQVAKAGGRVVKNVAGYDLMKLFTGSYGTLGIISQVTFRAYPLPEASETVLLTGTADALAQVTKALLGSALTPTAIDLLSTQLVARLGLGEGMGLIARFQSVAESVKEQSARLLEVGQTLGLKGSSVSGTDEANLWMPLQELMKGSDRGSAIACKIGVLPTAAVATLAQCDRAQVGMGLIHAGSGLGVLRFEGSVTPEIVLEMRRACQSQGGFLTILEAPIAFKQQLDVWGYTGNALDLMRKIKQQFDSENILSPCRFVAGI